MFAKLSIRNAKRSISDYIIYMVTMVISVTIFYAFMSITSSHYTLTVNDGYNLGAFNIIMQMGTVAITGVMVFLVAYVNRYMLRRRMKEFGGYIILGMEQKQVAFMFFMECLIIGTIAVIIGILIGVLFSQVLTVTLATALGQKATFILTLYPDTIGITFGFFLLMFLLNGIINMWYIGKTKLINMMNFHKKSETSRKGSGWIYGSIFILSLVIYAVAIAKIQQYNIYCAVALVIATYGLFLSGSWGVSFIKDKLEFIRYRNTNLFVLGDILFKVKSNSLGLANVAICFMVASAIFVATSFCTKWMVGYLNYRMVYDFRIEYRAEEKYPVDHNKIIDYMKSQNYGVGEYAKVEIKSIDKKAQIKSSEALKDSRFIGFSDFNKLRFMAGYSQAELGKGEFGVHWLGYKSEEEQSKFIAEIGRLEVDGETFKIAKDEQYMDSLGEGLYTGKGYLIILPDSAIESFAVRSNLLVVNTAEEMTYDQGIALREFADKWDQEEFKEYREKEAGDNRNVSQRVKVAERNNITNINFALKLQGMYAGIILIIIALTILALQQLQDGMENRDRFTALRRLGVDDSEVNKIVLKQMSVYFIVPLVIGAFGVCFFLKEYINIFGYQIRTFIGMNVLSMDLLASFGTAMVIYAAYFIAVYMGYKKNIQ